MRDVQATLIAAEATQAVAQPAAATLIPKPRGSSGRCNFNLANEMNVSVQTYRQIQVSAMLHISDCSLMDVQSFVRTLVNMLALDKSLSWKKQHGDEVHKIFTVVCSLTSPTDDLTDSA